MADPNAAPELEMFTPEQVRRILGCGRKRIYSLLNTGELPAIRLGVKRWRIRRQALADFLARAERKGR